MPEPTKDAFDDLLVFAKTHGLKVKARRSLRSHEQWRYHALAPAPIGDDLLVIGVSPAHLLYQLQQMDLRPAVLDVVESCVSALASVLDPKSGGLK